MHQFAKTSTPFSDSVVPLLYFKGVIKEQQAVIGQHTRDTAESPSIEQSLEFAFHRVEEGVGEVT